MCIHWTSKHYIEQCPWFSHGCTECHQSLWCVCVSQDFQREMSILSEQDSALWMPLIPSRLPACCLSMKQPRKRKKEPNSFKRHGARGHVTGFAIQICFASVFTQGFNMPHCLFAYYLALWNRLPTFDNAQLHRHRTASAKRRQGSDKIWKANCKPDNLLMVHMLTYPSWFCLSDWSRGFTAVLKQTEPTEI